MGRNESNNVIVEVDKAYDAYSGSGGAPALSFGGLLALSSGPQGNFGLYPALGATQKLYDSGLAPKRVNVLLGRVFLAIIMILATFGAADAQVSSGPNVALIGNHPAEAATISPVAHANSAAQLNMEVTLALRNTTALDQLLRDQQDPTSPRYHQWLTPGQFTAQFGPSQQSADAVSQWLTSRGFQVTATSLQGRYVRFRGSVADVGRAFATDLMAFGDGTSYSNTTDPMIPARFAGVIGGIRGLDNFLHSVAFSHRLSSSAPATASPWTAGPLAMLDPGPALPLTESNGIMAAPNVTIGGITAFGPADFYSFYDESPLISSAINGDGRDCLAIVGISDYTHSAIPLFNGTFGLPASTITTVLADTTNPGINDDELEALLDLEWSHAAAPGTATNFYLGNANTSTANGPIVDAIQRAVNDDTCSVISVGFGLCGGTGDFYTMTVSPIYAQAATQGQSIFIASGDDGAAGIVFDVNSGECVPGTSPNVNELGTDPNVTSVGGTSFMPNYFDGDNNGHVPESAWNDSSDSSTGGATGGGVSAFYTQPTYQKGPGVPVGGNRDVPDVALIASPNYPGAFIAAGSTAGATPVIECCIGGTSLSTPLWAGIFKLIAQLKGARLGPLNPTIYKLAQSGQAAVGLRDVISGNNDFQCPPPPGGTCVTGFAAGVGFDLATGWGTADINTFANSYVRGGPPTASPTPTPTATPSPSPTATPSPTQTPTTSPTSTQSPSRTPTRTPSPTLTVTSSPTPSETLVPTATPTARPTKTVGPSTATPTPLPTHTPTLTPVGTPTSIMTKSATPASTPTPTTMAPTATPTITPSSTPTVVAPATDFTAPGGRLVGAPGHQVNTSFTAANNTGAAETISSVTLSLSNPGLFSSLILSADHQSSPAAMPPDASNTFAFSPPLTLAAGASLTFTVTATIAAHPAMIAPNGGGVAYAAMVPLSAVIPNTASLPLFGSLTLLSLGMMLWPTGRRRRLVSGALVLVVLAASQVGCSGGSSAPTVVAVSSTVTVTAANASGADGATAGLPLEVITISTVDPG